MVRICCAFVVLVALASPVRADDTEPPTTFHKGQFGLSARFGIGVYGVAAYNNEYCGKLDATTSSGNAPVCTGRTPYALDLDASYGVARSVELTVEMRLGFERDVGGAPTMQGPRPFHLAPGARFFFSEEKHTKLFVQPEVVFDLSNARDAAGASRGTDFGVRGIEGFWIDLHRSYGIYVYVGETGRFARALYFGFDGGFGIQGRYP